jgi:Kef-type K+ transport system membrane component KefB
LVATSTGITARVLRDLGVLDSRESRIILGAAIIDDILAMILLALVSGLSEPGEFSAFNLVLIAAQAIGFVVFGALVGLRVVRRYDYYIDRLPLANAPLILALSMMLGLAALATSVGLAAIIGAFLAGMILAEAAEHYELERAVIPIYEFLVPLFFVVTGTQVDPGLFLNRDVLGLALLVTVVAILTKLIGAGVGGYGMGTRSMAIIGVGMVPRGEVGIIVANLGLSRGMISTEFFSIVAIMSILTTLIVPPALTQLYRTRPRLPAPVGDERMASAGRLPRM